MGIVERVSRRAGGKVVEGFFRGMAGLGQLHPRARPAKHGVELIRDVPYQATGSGDHLLDVYRPIGASPDAPLPALLYIHGGGFHILSKDTHWVMGIALARARFVVFSVNYRLAPTHRFPAAVEDVCEAYRWVTEHGAEYGADVSQLVVAGESAGGNLAAAVTLAACFEREEPWARRVFETGVVPKAVMPACAILQVTDTQRFQRRRPDMPRFVAERIEDVMLAYLGSRDIVPGSRAELDFCDPLLVFERQDAPARPIPPFFVPCGTADPLLDDSRRLASALRAMSVVVDEKYYPGEVHAFHAFVFRPQAKKCWNDTYAFLDTHVPRR
jgi:acetyl esterase